MNEKDNKHLKEESFDEFNFEVSSRDGLREFLTEMDEEDKEQEEEVPKQSTIKIISERDIQYKEAPPPNYIPYFKCILHFKDSDYRNRKSLDVASEEE